LALLQRSLETLSCWMPGWPINLL
jgi:hypothetical protein